MLKYVGLPKCMHAITQNCIDIAVPQKFKRTVNHMVVTITIEILS